MSTPLTPAHAPQLKPVMAIAPSSWASYLINGDDSGINADEINAADRWIERQQLGAPVSCEDAGFCRHHDAWTEAPFAADCQTYTFRRYETTRDDR